jgi:hypothetical protein
MIQLQEYNMKKNTHSSESGKYGSWTLLVTRDHNKLGSLYTHIKETENLNNSSEMSEVMILHTNV